MSLRKNYQSSPPSWLSHLRLGEESHLHFKPSGFGLFCCQTKVKPVSCVILNRGQYKSDIFCLLSVIHRRETTPLVPNSCETHARLVPAGTPSAWLNERVLCQRRTSGWNVKSNGIWLYMSFAYGTQTLLNHFQQMCSLSTMDVINLCGNEAKWIHLANNTNYRTIEIQYFYRLVMRSHNPITSYR